MLMFLQSEAYNKFLEGRRAEMAHILYPDSQATVDDWDEYRSAKALRLMPGDTGYVAWAAALLFFMDEVKAISTRFYGDILFRTVVTIPSREDALAAAQREVPFVLSKTQESLVKLMDPERELERASRNDVDVTKAITSEAHQNAVLLYPRGIECEDSCYTMSSSIELVEDDGQEDPKTAIPEDQITAQMDPELPYIRTQKVKTNRSQPACDQPANAQDRKPKFSEMSQQALLYKGMDGVPIGTFKPDHLTDPHLRRLVYARMDAYGKLYLLLSALGTDGGTYVHQTQSKRKNSQGVVSFYDLQPFSDVPAIDIADIAEWVFKQLKRRGSNPDLGGQFSGGAASIRKKAG
ncbi:hypothetical protein Aspvir_007487 [Aspergillus viridinutans]|uniref:Uncharacterized protein n=1 Tax=Aspergillus viridinutans TaxID=75553 RepID=A0A9P3F6S6_ASPVI|nr:uncharacterized protein Aspvir_007487 [Aspergillus viridinutans]GIK03418.1 hypothetical protein Aspvir_007487 [Aspergillus viridinutans]